MVIRGTRYDVWTNAGRVKPWTEPIWKMVDVATDPNMFLICHDASSSLATQLARGLRDNGWRAQLIPIPPEAQDHANGS